jgi:hypothetical protein
MEVYWIVLILVTAPGQTPVTQDAQPFHYPTQEQRLLRAEQLAFLYRHSKWTATTL